MPDLPSFPHPGLDPGSLANKDGARLMISRNKFGMTAGVFSKLIYQPLTRSRRLPWPLPFLGIWGRGNQSFSFSSPLGEAQIFLKIWVREQYSRTKQNR